MLKIDLTEPILYVWGGQYLKTDDAPWLTRTQTSAEQIKLIMPAKGVLHVALAGVDYEVQPGDCLIVPPFTTMTGTRTTKGEVSFYWIQFLAKTSQINQDDPLIAQALQHYSNAEKAPDTNNYAFLPTLYTLNDAVRIHLFFREMLAVTNISAYSERGRDFFTGFFITELCTDYLSCLKAATHHRSDDNHFMPEWIRANISPDLTVQSVADHFGLNPSYVSRLFKSKFNIGVKEYILLAKMDYAKYLLTTSVLQINEISIQAGFGDVKHFDHTFKKLSGVSPTMYREFFTEIHYNSSRNDPKPPLPHEFGTTALHQLIRAITTPENSSAQNNDQDAK